MAKRNKATWEDLRKRVDKSEIGFVTVSAGELKRLAGFRKLGRFVIAKIADDLHDNGLGYFPEIPVEAPRQGMAVRVFKLGSRAELAIMAASRVGPEEDQVLTELVLDKTTNLTPTVKLREIERILSSAA